MPGPTVTATTSTGASGGRGTSPLAPALPAIYDRCSCGDLASVHDIGVRQGVRVRTACACGSCDCRMYQHATEVTR